MNTFKKTLSLFLAALIACSMLSAMGTLSFAVGLQGSGTVNAPYEIGDYAQLKEFAYIINSGETGACAILTGDIVCKDNPDDTDYAADWIPIGNISNKYTGTFDGRSYAITGLSTPENCSDDNTGFFGYVGSGGVIKNVCLEDITITGRDGVGGAAGRNEGAVQNCYSTGSVSGRRYVGGVAGYNSGTVINCYNTGSVSGNYYIGGVVGDNLGGALTNCYNTGFITSAEEFAGGVAGRVANSTITDCYNTGGVYGHDVVGGVVGECLGEVRNCRNSGPVSGDNTAGGVAGKASESSEFTTCFNTGSVNAINSAGGLVGWCLNSAAANCYNTGYISGDNSIGGIFGIGSGATAENCFNSGDILANSSVGGIVGNPVSGTFTDCYYDKTKCGEIGALNGADDASNNVIGLTTFEMTGSNALTSLAGFSSDKWLTKTSGSKYLYYPHLKGFEYDENPADENWPSKLNLKDGCLAGSGTADSPYQISNYLELKILGAKINSGETAAWAVLMADIVCKNNPDDTEYADDWTPIGDKKRKYTGTFDGSGYTITGLSMSEEYSTNYGFFNYVGSGGIIENVCFEDVNTSGGSLGAAVGNNEGTVTNCINMSTVSGGSDVGSNVGGLVGYNYGTVTNCGNTGAVSGRAQIGGVVGYNYGTVKHCFNTGFVSASFSFSYVGGVVGYNLGSVSDCYNTGNVSGNKEVGGIVGDNTGIVTNCYSTGSVSGNSQVGGVAGENYYGTVKNCYSAGSVSGNSGVGGVAGKRSGGTVKNCYYDTEYCSCPGAISGADDVSNNVIGLATLSMTGLSTLDYFQMNFEYGEGEENPWLTKANGSLYYYPHLKGFEYDTNPTDENWPAKRVSANRPLGSGTSVDPYQISNYAQLREFAYIINGGETGACAILMGDIVCKYNPNNTDYAKDWVPIGNFSIQYTGTFDGRGYKITGLSTPENYSKDYAGLFGYVGEEGTVKNTSLEAGCITGIHSVGSVAGYNCGTVTNCSNTGTVSGSVSVGGVAGNNDGAVKNCYNTGAVSSTVIDAGGVVGNNHGDIELCYNTGNVSGADSAGGLAGCNYIGSTITNCYNEGRVLTTGHSAGGVAGDNLGTVKSCYNTGIVSGYSMIGGVAGYNYGTVKNSYSMGIVSAGSQIGGVVGYNEGTVRNCYYDKQIFSFRGAINGADDELNNVFGLTTSQMTGNSALESENMYFDYGEGEENTWITKARRGRYLFYPHLKGFIYDTYPTESNWPAKTLIPYADYSALDALLDSLPDDFELYYTDESVDALYDLISSFNYGLTVYEQDIVDGYVDLLAAAIDALYPEPTASISADKIIRGQRATWTVVTPDDVVWLRFTNYYFTDLGGEGTIITSCKYNKANIGSTEISVSDENGMRTWTISMPFTYAGTASYAEETVSIEYKRNGSSVWSSVKTYDITLNKIVYAKDIIVAKNADIFAPPTPNYDKYELVDAQADIEAGTFTVITTDDVSKIRISYTDANTGKSKSYAYQATSTSVISYENKDGLTTWVVKFKFNAPAENNTYSVQARGPAWGEAYNVTTDND